MSVEGASRQEGGETPRRTLVGRKGGRAVQVKSI